MPTPKFENDINILASYPFPEIELKYECDPNYQRSNSILFLDSILTPVSLPDFNHFSSQY